MAIEQTGKFMVLKFFVEQVVFQNKETGYAVLIGTLENKESIFAVGSLFGVDVGQHLKIEGSFQSHRVYGRQFLVERFKQTMPTDEFAIRKFLSAGVVKGIGPVLCERIVDRFKSNTLQIMENSPQELLKVKGVSRALLEKIKPDLEKLFALKRLLIFLETFNLKSIYGARAWRKWGVFALDKIKSNPFVLTEQGVDLSFFEADVIAQKFKLSSSSVLRIESAVKFVLKHNALENGHTCAPISSVMAVANDVLKLSAEVVELAVNRLVEDRRLLSSVFINKKFLFLPTYFLAEQFIAQRILALVRYSGENETISLESVDNFINFKQQELGFELVEKQRLAIKKAVASGVFILTGGPGTGKTTILKVVVSVLEQQGLKVAICAPTGRAAKRLSELTGRFATTIHRLLGVYSNNLEESAGEFVHCQDNLLDHDVIIVDEMSMVDCLLFYGLLKAMQPFCRLILTGDCNQLPSVSAGNVLKNLIECEQIPRVELNEIFRQAAKSLIVKNAHLIVKGKLPELHRTDGNFFFINESRPSVIVNLVVSLVTKRLVKTYAYNPLTDLQVICLFKKGLVGTINLNKMLQNKLNEKSKNKEEFQFGLYIYREGDKVMQVKNDYEIKWQAGSKKGEGIFNGDIGFIKKINKHDQIFVVDFEGKIVTYNFSQAVEIELAYAITVHKSQGNEFRCVVLPVLAKQTEFFSRNLLYTAVTRAKENLVLIGSETGIEFMCGQVRVNYRYSGLKHFILSEQKRSKEQ